MKFSRGIHFALTSLNSRCVSVESIYLKTYMALFRLQLKTKGNSICLQVAYARVWVAAPKNPKGTNVCRQKEHKLKLRTRAGDSNNRDRSFEVQGEDLLPS